MKHPLIDYQPGSIRDDFDFGPLLFLKKNVLQIACKELQDEQSDALFSGLYQLRLAVSRKFSIERISEPIYIVESSEVENSDDKLFENALRTKGKSMANLNQYNRDKISKFAVPKFMEINRKLYFVSYINSNVLKSEVGNSVIDYVCPHSDFSATYSIDDRNNENCSNESDAPVIAYIREHFVYVPP